MKCSKEMVPRIGLVFTFLITISFLLFSACSNQSSTNTNKMEYRETIKTYFRSYKEADRETLRSLLTDDFHHISAFSEFNDPDEMLDTIWAEVGKSWAEELEIFGEHPEYMVRYKVVGGDQPARYMSGYIQFKDDKIAEIESYTGRELE